jgi:hypothetical protein
VLRKRPTSPSSSTDVAGSFHCSEQARSVCPDALVTYQGEVAGTLDFAASGLDSAACASVVE